MSEPIKYCIDPLAPFPPRWFDHIGNITVMTNPVKGYVMVRRPGAVPFVLSVAQLLNAEKHPTHGPFTLMERTPKVRTSHRRNKEEAARLQTLVDKRLGKAPSVSRPNLGGEA